MKSRKRYSFWTWILDWNTGNGRLLDSNFGFELKNERFPDLEFGGTERLLDLEFDEMISCRGDFEIHEVVASLLEPGFFVAWFGSNSLFGPNYYPFFWFGSVLQRYGNYLFL
ncbi:unnamed protein product [Rhizophagus irregularis]|nr:unnamed protein product [Rhizophagus irregularis]